MTATTAGVVSYYRNSAATLRARRAVQSRLVDRLGNGRLAAFGAALLLAARWATASGGQTAWLAAASAVTVGFAALVWWSNRAKAQLQRTDDLITLADEGAHRAARHWSELPVRDWEPAPASHPYAVDLDLFGEASLAQLLPPMSSAPGRTTLRSWLVAPAAPAVVEERQLAVAELARDSAFRDELARRGMRIASSAQSLAELEAWARSDGWLRARPALLAATIAIPCATLGLAAAQLAGAVAHSYWIAPAIIGWALTARHGKAFTRSFAPVVGRSNTLRRYAQMARLVSETRFTGPALTGLQARLAGGPRPAHASMRTLTALADCSELRLSPMLYVIVNTLTLWDFHVVHLLERWQEASGRHVGQWLGALGEIESLSALATVAHDNPDWTFPRLDVTAPVILEAKALGHPLLSDDEGVRNDVTVGPAGTILVVTGSNMAGKSTLLRSIGLNLVLSQAGSVVCARALRHPPAVLHTSMRVQDSLARGVSYFMAELERLKTVVDAADAMPPHAPRVLVYLLDEILHGTNSAERTIAARHVLTHLAASGAIGAVSTHDLQLVDVPELAAVARHVHFQETFSRADGAASMSFDYRLRPGKATSSNALKLLELVGLLLPPYDNS